MHVTRAPKSLNRVDLVVTDGISIQCLASLTTNIENYRHNYKMYINILFYSRGSTVECYFQKLKKYHKNIHR